MPELRHEAVADAPHVLDEVVLAAELVPDAAHVLGHRRGHLPLLRRAPHVLEELAPREHAARVGGQVGEEVELSLGELDRAAVEGDLARLGVDHQPAAAAASSCSTFTRPAATLTRMAWPWTSTLSRERADGQRSRVEPRTPRVPVSTRSTSANAPTRAGSTRALTVCAGRPFFITIGV